jgi:hypothetical protein
MGRFLERNGRAWGIAAGSENSTETNIRLKQTK